MKNCPKCKKRIGVFGLSYRTAEGRKWYQYSRLSNVYGYLVCKNCIQPLKPSYHYVLSSTVVLFWIVGASLGRGIIYTEEPTIIFQGVALTVLLSVLYILKSNTTYRLLETNKQRNADSGKNTPPPVR